MSGCTKIRHIVRLRQMLRRWRNNSSVASRITYYDVPSGHVAVNVGSNCKRYVIRTRYLNHPLFKKLLAQAEEEFGFTNSGPLAIPCDEYLFEEVIRYLDRTDSKFNNSTRLSTLEEFQRYCHVKFQSNLGFWSDSRPLLNGVSDKSIW